MKSRNRLSFAVAVLAVASAAAARADGGGAEPPGGAAAAERPFRDFAKGSWATHAYGGYLNDLGPQDTEGGFGAVGASYFFTDNMSLGAELTGYGFSQPGPEAVAGGPGIVFRHHVYNSGPASVFLDVTAGFFEASERVPSGGTRFNFIEQVGTGMTYRLAGNSHLLLGVRYVHISNAQIEGDDRNPSVNGITGYLGMLFTF